MAGLARPLATAASLPLGWRLRVAPGFLLPLQSLGLVAPLEGDELRLQGRDLLHLLANHRDGCRELLGTTLGDSLDHPPLDSTQAPCVSSAPGPPAPGQTVPAALTSAHRRVHRMRTLIQDRVWTGLRCSPLAGVGQRLERLTLTSGNGPPLVSDKE